MRTRILTRADDLADWVKEHAPSPSTNHLIVMALVVSVLVLSIAGATLMMTVQGRSVQDGQVQDSRITSCRASLNVRLVTGPTAKALKALSKEGQDSDAFRDAVDESNPDLFVALSILSDSDPDEFLTACRKILTRTG